MPPPVTGTNDRVPETLTTIGLRVSFTAGATKALYYLFTYLQLKPAVTSFSESSNRLFQVQPKPPSIGFATFREWLNDFSTIFLYFGLAALLAGLVLDRLEQTKNSQ